MKKLIIILCCLIVALNSFSQNVQSNNSFIFQPTTNPVTTFRIKNGLLTVDSAIYLPSRENNWTPTKSGAIQFAPTQSALYYYNLDSAKWLLVGSGGGGGSPPSLATLTPGFGLIGVTYDPYSTNQTWLVDTSAVASITYINNFFADTGQIAYTVQNVGNDPPVSPIDSAYYLVGTAPTGIWTTHENQIARRIGTGYEYTTPPASTIISSIEEHYQLQYIGGVWIIRTIFLVQNGNAVGTGLYTGTQDNQSFHFITNDTTRFIIDSLGRKYYPEYAADTSTSYTVGAIIRNGYLDTVHARDLILTTTGSSGAATLINNVLNIPQYSGGGGGGTVTDFSAGNLSPLFTSSVATSTSTPALTFAQSNTTQFTVLGRIASGSGAYSFVTADSTLIQGLHSESYYNTKYLTANQTITLSGDVSGSGTTAITTTIGNNKVMDAMLRQSAGLSVIGNSTNATANVADITGADHQLLRVAGTTLGFGTVDSSYVTGLHTEAYYNTKYGTGNGTVTSVATNTATGITGGTITTTGTLAIDTNLISTRAWRQKGIDSVVSLIKAGTVTNVTGTAPVIITSTSTITPNVTVDTSKAVGRLATYTDDQTTRAKTVSSYAKNTTRDSTILTLADGTRYAAKDSVGSGGGGGITKSYLPLVVTAGGDSIYQRVNVLAYGATGNGVTNDATAIQNAINAADTLHAYVYFPSGTYIVSNAIDATCNCQIKIPQHSDSKRNNILLQGEGAPSPIPVGGGLTGSVASIATGGAIIKSTITTGAAGAAVIGTATSGSNLTALTIESLTIMVKNNPAGAGPVVGGISYKTGYNLYVNNTVVSIDTSGEKSTTPTNDISGIEFPDNSLGSSYYASNDLVIGFKNGYKIGEWVAIDNCEAWCCANGVNAKAGSHSSYASRFNAQWCKNDIYFSGALTLIVSSLDDEYMPSSYAVRWYNNVYTINDSLNQGAGIINYTLSQAGSTRNNAHFVVNGAKYISTGIDGVLNSINYSATSGYGLTINNTNNSATSASLLKFNNSSNYSALIGKLSPLFTAVTVQHANDLLIQNSDSGNIELQNQFNGRIGLSVAGASTEGATLTSTGLGINNQAPSYPLDVTSSVGTIARFTSTAAGSNAFLVLHSATGKNMWIVYGINTTDYWYAGIEPSNQRYALNDGGAELFTVLRSTGNVGLGQAAPTFKLDVNGTARFVSNVTIQKPIITSGSTPTNTLGTGAGTSPSVTITGNDMSGYISLTTGTSPTAGGNIITVFFSATLSSAAKSVQLTAANEAAAVDGTKYFVDQANTGTGGFVIKNISTGALQASTAYIFYYAVTQ